MTERGRDAKTGEFIPTERARGKAKATVEQVKNTGGKNNTDRGKGGKFKK
jgi:hypothetical protein